MREAKFLVTDECRRLARWLRLCGYDTLVTSAIPLSRLYQRAVNEGRVVVTRNGKVRAGVLLRVVPLQERTLEAQLHRLVVEGLVEVSRAAVFSRCDVCNALVEPVAKSTVESHVPPYVFQTQHTFHRCPSCQRIYWAATHWQRASALLARIR